MANLADYYHKGIIDQFMHEQNCSEIFAKRVFDELKKFLFVAAKRTENESCTPSLLVDEMWHLFLDKNADYQNFCVQYVGKKIGHRINKLPLARYQATKKAITQSFGSIDEKIWPVVTGKFAPASCDHGG